MNTKYMRERCTNTEFYKTMFEIREEKECSIRGLAKECGLCYGTLIEFFNVDKPFRPLSDITMIKIHKNLGIDYEVMHDYNDVVINARENDRGE
jgi:hypothetical protein